MARDIHTALDRRFTRASYATRAFALFTRAVAAFKAWQQGRLDERLSLAATEEFIAFVYGAGYPRRMAMRIRPGRD